MNSPTEFQDNEDLAFFGKVNASISHELKNILAIISETAGLLNDLTEMAKEGKTVEPETFGAYSKDIVEEVQRGFVTIKQMNRFAHSVDETYKTIELTEIVELVTHLAGFLSFASRVRFLPREGSSPAVYTCPFRLQNLLYKALVFAFESAGPQGEVHVAIDEGENRSVQITLTGLGPDPDRPFPDEKTNRIAESIRAEVLVKKDAGALVIRVPENSGHPE